MTAAGIAAVYLLALAWFLGLDILGKVPPTGFTRVTGALGALCAVAVVAGMHLEIGEGGWHWTRGIGVALAAAAVGAAAASLWRHRAPRARARTPGEMVER